MNQVFHIEGQGISLRVTVYTDKIFRVTYGEAPPDSMIVTAEPSDTRVTAAEGEGEWVISTAALRAVVDMATLNVRFERPDGTSLSREYGKTLQAYDIYKTVGGNTELRQTVDGLRATLADWEDPHHIGGVFFGSC